MGINLFLRRSRMGLWAFIDWQDNQTKRSCACQLTDTTMQMGQLDLFAVCHMISQIICL